MNTLRRMRRSQQHNAGYSAGSSGAAAVPISGRDQRSNRSGQPPSRRSQNPNRGYQEGRGNYQQPKGIVLSSSYD